MPDLPTCASSVANTATAPTAPPARRVRELRPADLLSLAAAPTFLAMTVATALGEGAPMICSDGQGAFPLTGMAMMYLLMSAFHLAPWLRLVSSGR